LVFEDFISAKFDWLENSVLESRIAQLELAHRFYRHQSGVLKEDTDELLII